METIKSVRLRRTVYYTMKSGTVIKIESTATMEFDFDSQMHHFEFAKYLKKHLKGWVMTSYVAY